MNKFTFKIAYRTDFEQKLADVRKKVVFIQILQALNNWSEFHGSTTYDYLQMKPMLTPTYLVLCEWNKLLYRKCNFTHLEITFEREVLKDDLW